MEQKRSYNYKVDPQSVDFMKRATIVALGGYLLDTAGEDADKRGFGVRNLNAQNASWVLTRMAIEVRRMPVEYEELRVATWVSDVSRVMTTRNFEVMDSAGEVIAVSVTNWAMIDLTTRKPLDLHNLQDYNSMTQDFPVPAPLPVKVSQPEHIIEAEHTVVYSDIDFNCHTNSMKYLQWVIDTVPIESMEKLRFARIDINFVQESRHGERLLIYGDGDLERRYEICNADGRAVCRISFRMES